VVDGNGINGSFLEFEAVEGLAAGALVEGVLGLVCFVGHPALSAVCAHRGVLAELEAGEGTALGAFGEGIDVLVGLVLGEAVLAVGHEGGIFMVDEAVLLAASGAVCRPCGVLAFVLGVALGAVGRERCFFGELEDALGLAPGAVHGEVHVLMCFVFSVTVGADCRKGFLVCVADAIGFSAEVALGMLGRVAVDDMLSKAVVAVAVHHGILLSTIASNISICTSFRSFSYKSTLQNTFSQKEVTVSIIRPVS
jgi:hypothetical protein